MSMGTADIYTLEYYARIAKVEDQHWWHLGMREIARAMMRRAQLHDFQRILDAGCGTGAIMAWAGRSFDAAQVFGTDIAQEALTFCVDSKRAVTCASVLQLPYASECFDLVICNDVIQHLPTAGGDQQGLDEMHRVLRLGGVLSLRTNSRLGTWQAAKVKDVDFQRYTLAEVSFRLRAAGFEVAQATYANAVAGAHDAVRRFCRRSPRLEPGHQQVRVYEGLAIRDTARLHPWLNRLLLAALRGEAWLVCRGVRLPFGHSIVVLARKTSSHGIGSVAVEDRAPAQPAR